MKTVDLIDSDDDVALSMSPAFPLGGSIQFCWVAEGGVLLGASEERTGCEEGDQGWWQWEVFSRLGPISKGHK